MWRDLSNPKLVSSGLAHNWIRWGRVGLWPGSTDCHVVSRPGGAQLSVPTTRSSSAVHYIDFFSGAGQIFLFRRKTIWYILNIVFRYCLKSYYQTSIVGNAIHILKTKPMLNRFLLEQYSMDLTENLHISYTLILGIKLVIEVERTFHIGVAVIFRLFCI